MVLHNINTGLYVLRVNIGLNDIFNDGAVSDDQDQGLSDGQIAIISVAVAIVILLLIIITMIYCKRKEKERLLKKYENMEDIEQTGYGTTAQ